MRFLFTANRLGSGHEDDEYGHGRAGEPLGQGYFNERALALLTHRIEADKWPEYYDGKRGGLIGRRANFYQTWSATGLIVASELLGNPANLTLFDRCTQVDLEAGVAPVGPHPE